MGKFGWSLPPGVTKLPYDDDYPCEICGHDAASCVCPVCPRCGQQGDPDCYREPDLGICGELHGKETPLQKLEYQRFRVAEALAQYQEECQILDYLEEQASDYKEGGK